MPSEDELSGELSKERDEDTATDSSSAYSLPPEEEEELPLLLDPELLDESLEEELDPSGLLALLLRLSLVTLPCLILTSRS